MNRRTSVIAIALAVVAVLIGAPVLAGAAAGAQQKNEQAAGPAYVCLKDRVGADQPGPCPICKAEMQKAGKFVCPSCDTTSDKPGKCACGKELIPTATAFKQCPDCKHWISKDAKVCPVCQQNKS